MERSDFHHSSFFNLQSSFFNYHPGSGALGPGFGRDKFGADAAGFLPLLSDR
jgi:hypothetical protein